MIADIAPTFSVQSVVCKAAADELGHKDVKMTQRYARVTQKKLFEDMDKFIAATEKDFILAL